MLAQPALKKLAGLKLDAKLRYHVIKLLKLVTAELRDHFYEERDQLLQELGKERPATEAEMERMGSATIRVLPTELIPAFEARMKTVTEVPVTIPWGPVTLTQLEPYLEFTAEDFDGLGPLGVIEDQAPA